MKRILVVVLCGLLVCGGLMGCGKEREPYELYGVDVTDDGFPYAVGIEKEFDTMYTAYGKTAGEVTAAPERESVDLTIDGEVYHLGYTRNTSLQGETYRYGYDEDWYCNAERTVLLYVDRISGKARSLQVSLPDEDIGEALSEEAYVTRAKEVMREMEVNLGIGEWTFSYTVNADGQSHKVVATQRIDGKKVLAHVSVQMTPSGKLRRYDNIYVAREFTEEREIDYDDDWAMQSIAMKLEEWFEDCPYELRGFNVIDSSPLVFFQMEDGRIAVELHITVYFYRGDAFGEAEDAGRYAKSSMAVLMILN